jgi:hypothetical protein
MGRAAEVSSGRQSESLSRPKEGNSTTDLNMTKMTESTDEQHAEDYLRNILSQAFRDKDDAVEIQPLAMGLEISWVAYGSGVGTIVPHGKLADAILELITTRAGLATTTHGELPWRRGNKKQLIPVEKFQRAGATCYRLDLKPKTPPAPRA